MRSEDTRLTPHASTRWGEGTMSEFKAGDMTDEEFIAFVRSPAFAERMNARPEPQKTPREILVDNIREAHTPEQRDSAVEWVMRVFDPMIRHKEQSKEVYFVDITSTKRTRKAGITTAGKGWREVIHLGVETLSLYYIHIILDDSIKTDEEKIRAMIAECSRKKDEADNPLVEVWGSLYDKAWKYIDGPRLEMWTHVVK